MDTLLAPLKGINAYHTAVECIDRNRLPMHISGCVDSQKAHLIWGFDFPWKVIITENELKARALLEEYRMFDREVLYFPAKDVIFFSADVHGNALSAERLRVIEALLRKKGGTVITSLDAGLELIPALSLYEKQRFRICEAERIDLEKVSMQLVDMGYTRESQVEKAGDFSIRGGILDIFPITEECPYRIELWGDEIDTIRSFDVESQRSITRMKEISVFPATEFIVAEKEIRTALDAMEADSKKLAAKLKKEKSYEAAERIRSVVRQVGEDFKEFGSRMGLEAFLPYFSIDTGSFFDYFDVERTLFFVDEPMHCMEKMNSVETEFSESMKNRLEQGYILPKQMEALYSSEIVLGILNRKKVVYLTLLDALPKELAVKESLHIEVQPVGSYNKHFELLAEDLQRFKKRGFSVLLLSASRTRAERLSKDLNEYDIPAFYSAKPDRALAPGEIMVSYGFLNKGFSYMAAKFTVITEGDIFGSRAKEKRRKQKKYSGQAIHNFNELSVGDYVVHENQGLGIYRGIEKIQVDHVTKDYIKVEYGDGGNLYVPVSGLDVLQKYAGQDAKPPKLNKLNSTEWKKTKAKVRSAVAEIAKDLVLLYAKRQKLKGFMFSEDTVWQREFEELFPFEETQDQLRAIEETKKDMESDRIMDRLICGDVGYGKTEIALRAAFKAVNDGKQVAFLVPTTILAQQHFNTFRERLGDFPVKVEMLSRFRTTAQQKKTVEALKKGQVDVVIGTHRLLSKDVTFKDLGLLVVDEEQRFGVTHKEKIKKLKGNVDVLTLSATPIPRTLHMSLVGIRDMSVLEEPPVDRLPIQTFIMEHNREIIREAISRELARGGQVYYVYNRVQHIEEVAADLMAMLPEAEIAFAHGQMSERELENIMLSFINGEIDVLVATTIIETGLDIANVNTIIIDHADRMGLSQLYQLRGRVGRSNRTAYAFLMYQHGKLLKEVAEKRLAAIREYTDLGSGIRVAMRDLEIRGAGNLLGAAQSGHMAAVGYDLYCKMLNEAVRQLKGEEVEEEFETNIDLQVDAYIPAAYIPSEFIKLDIYKKIAGIENKEDYQDMQDELLDRFGTVPVEAENLLKIAFLKAQAHHAGITQIMQKPGTIRFYLKEQSDIRPDKARSLIEGYQGKVKYIPEEEPYLVYLRKEPSPSRVITTGYTGADHLKKKQGKAQEAEKIFAIAEEMITKIGGLYEKTVEN